MQQHQLVIDRHCDNGDDDRYLAAFANVSLSRSSFRRRKSNQRTKCVCPSDDFGTDAADATATTTDGTAATAASTFRRLQHCFGQPISNNDLGQ